MIHDEPARAACANLPDIFQSVLAYDHQIAVGYCLGNHQRPACPMLAACRANTPGRDGWHDGTWGGDLYSNGVKIREAGKRVKR